MDLIKRAALFVEIFVNILGAEVVIATMKIRLIIDNMRFILNQLSTCYLFTVYYTLKMA